MRQHNILHELLFIQAGSINNLFSYEALTYKGSVLYVNRKINEYIEQGLVRQIPFNIRPTHSRRQFLYQVTIKGAKLIGREKEYRNKDQQSYNAINHESMKYDVALAFVRLFPDYNIKIEYEKTFKSSVKNLRADIFIKATKLDGSKEYDFIIETEHKDDLRQTFNDKVKAYDKAIKNGLLKQNGLSDRTKVLFVCSHSHLSTFIRPQEYKQKEYLNNFSLSYKQFENLMGLVQDLDDKHFRFIPFLEFTKINQPIWRMPSGIKVKIIE